MNSHPLRVGIGGPVGSGKTALTLALCRALRERYNLAVVTNDIYTQEDAEFLVRNEALAPERIIGVETGGCPHTAIREDASINLEAIDRMRAAGRPIPEDVKLNLAGMTVTHDFNKFWEMMRREKGSKRPPLTEAQRKQKPPVSHPIFLVHPITRRKVLYANPGYSMRINELPQAESNEILEFLFEHQLKPEYRYRHQWSEGDVLMWDNIGTIHNAIGDYTADEPRYMRRIQVMATLDYQRILAD